MILGTDLTVTVRCDRCDTEHACEIPRTTTCPPPTDDNPRRDLDDVIDEALRNQVGPIFYDRDQVAGGPHLCDRCFYDPDVEDRWAKTDPAYAADLAERRSLDGQRVAKLAVDCGYWTAEDAAEAEL